MGKRDSGVHLQIYKPAFQNQKIAFDVYQNMLHGIELLILDKMERHTLRLGRVKLLARAWGVPVGRRSGG